MAFHIEPMIMELSPDVVLSEVTLGLTANLDQPNRWAGGAEADMLGRLAGDKRLGLKREKLEGILADGSRFVGAAPQQVDEFVAMVAPLAKKIKGAASYQPGKLL